MNKSKFLKKSLAALLAILMVAAMIPLSAAAAQIGFAGENGIDTIRTTAGELTKKAADDDSNWVVTLPYQTGDSTTITLTTQRDPNSYTVLTGTTAEDAELRDGVTSPSVDVKDVTVASPKKAVIILRPVVAEGEEAQEDIVYNFEVVKTPTSNSTKINAATYEYTSGKTVDGVVSGKTITFTVPWGEVPDGANSVNAGEVKITMDKVPAGFNGSVTVPASAGAVTSTDKAYILNGAVSNGAASMLVTAQDGGTDIYTVKFVEEAALKSITVAGVAAVQDKDNPKKWTVNIDPVKIAGNAIVKVTAGKTIGQFSFVEHTSPATSAAFTAGSTKTVNFGASDAASSGHLNDDNKTFDIAIKDTATSPNTASGYELTLKHVKSSDISIKSVDVTIDGYKEVGKIDGNKINVTVPKATADLTAATLNVATTSSTAALSLNEGAATGTGTLSATNKAVLGENSIDVTAQDGKTTTRYILNITKAPSAMEDADAAVTKAVMTFNGTDEYVGVPDKKAKTITFTVPASANKGGKIGDSNTINAALAAYVANDEADAGGANKVKFAWETTDHTQVLRGERASTKKSALISNAVKIVESKAKDGVAGKLNGVPSAALTTTSFFEGDAFPSIVTDGNRFYELKADVIAWTDDVADYVTAAPTEIVNKIMVKADGGTADGVEWKVIFKQAGSEKGHSLSNITFYTAAFADEKTDEKTFAGSVSSSGVTIAKPLPYATYKDNTTVFVPEFTVSKLAKLYVRQSDGSTLTELTASGYNDNGTPKFSGLKGDVLSAAKSLIVVSEDGWKGGALANYAAITALGSAKYTEYPLTVTKTDESEAKDIISLGSEDGLVTSVIDAAAGTIVLTVPTDYVVKGSETYFNLAIETSPLVSTVSSFGTEKVIENVQVKGNDEDGYKLFINSTAVEQFTVTAENGTTKLFKLTVQVADLDDDNSLSGITVKDVAATEGEDNAWTVELPYGTDLAELTTDDVVATVAEKADYTVAAGEEEGIFTITVKAENGQTADYTLTVTVADEPENPFQDVGDNWATDSIIKAAKLGWIQGKGNGKFDPKGEMTRAQFALIIARIQAGGNDAWEEVAGDYTTDVYNDVSATNSYMNAIAYVTEEGIMSGKGAGKFDPNGTITRQEAAKVMAIASGLEEIPGNTAYSDDASIAGWAKGYVNAVTEKNIMNGMGAGFSPNVKLTREMGATILVRAFDKAEEPEVPAE